MTLSGKPRARARALHDEEGCARPLPLPPAFPPAFPPPFPPSNGAVTQPAPVQGNGGSAYVSSPGAVQGRATGGFIGSGFATGR